MVDREVVREVVHVVGPHNTHAVEGGMVLNQEVDQLGLFAPVNILLL